MTQFIAMSLDTLGTDDAKRPRVEKIQSDLVECMAPSREIERGLLLTLADGVARGAVASAEVEEALGQLNTAAKVMFDCRPDALNALHAVLSPGEREALADKVQAGWAVWREANEEEAEQPGHHRGRMLELTQELSLSAEQVEHISDSVDHARDAGPDSFDAKASESRLQAFTTAFAGEVFDAKAIIADANGPLMTQGARRMVRFYQAVTPFLTEAQRAALAEHLRAHADHQRVISAK